MHRSTTPAPAFAGERSRRDFLRAIGGGALLASTAGCVGLARPPASSKDRVITVRGPIAGADLGFTLPHEHVLITHATDPSRNLTDPEAAVRELALYASAGGRTLVELTNIGIKRDPAALRSISERTGVNIVMGAGYYKDKWLPPETHRLSVEDMTAQIVRDLEVGVDGTGIRAGIIGEVGLGRPMTPTEERGLRAAARAQRRTGVGISLHFDIGGGLAEHEAALDILAAEGADLKRVVVGHFLPNLQQIPHFQQVAKRGCFVEFDLFGLENIIRRPLPPALEVKCEVIRQLVAEGLSSHLLLSQDVCFKGCLVENGGQGYAHLLRNILPRLEAIGVERSAIHRITVENPRRLLAIPAQ